MDSNIIEKFLSNIEVITESGCWIWTAGVVADGYGSIFVDGKHVRSHRLSWVIYKGEIPEGMLVCHKCDIPACVNPYHLFLGTPKDNMMDKSIKGRCNAPSGESHYRAKLTDKDIEYIRFSNKENKELSEMFGISKPYVSRIKNCKRRT